MMNEIIFVVVLPSELRDIHGIEMRQLIYINHNSLIIHA